MVKKQTQNPGQGRNANENISIDQRRVNTKRVQHTKYIKIYTNQYKRKLSAINFKAANVVPGSFLPAVPDGIGA